MSHFEGVTIKPLYRLPKDPMDCWQWIGSIDSAGYGRKMHRGESLTCSRWMWETQNGKLPDCLVISNSCGNKACCNPYHAVITTMTGAKRDGINTTLTTADVLEIKRAKATKTLHTATHLADKFGVDSGAIRAIWRGETWKGKGAKAIPAIMAQAL